MYRSYFIFERGERKTKEGNKAKRGRDKKMQPTHQRCFAHVAVFGEFFDRYMSDVAHVSVIFYFLTDT